MGGSAALTFAALHPRLFDGVASMNAVANYLECELLEENVQKAFGGTRAEIPNEYKMRSADFWPEKLAIPVGLTVGGKDPKSERGAATN